MSNESETVRANNSRRRRQAVLFEQARHSLLGVNLEYNYANDFFCCSNLIRCLPVNTAEQVTSAM